MIRSESGIELWSTRCGVNPFELTLNGLSKTDTPCVSFTRPVLGSTLNSPARGTKLGASPAFAPRKNAASPFAASDQMDSGTIPVYFALACVAESCRSSGAPPPWRPLSGYISSHRRPSSGSTKRASHPLGSCPRARRWLRVSSSIRAQTGSATTRPSLSNHLPVKQVSVGKSFMAPSG